jgi:hypothetical protein
VVTPDREIVVAISAVGPELRGTVRTADGPDQPFMGWLGLLSALQVAVEARNPGEVNA